MQDHTTRYSRPTIPPIDRFWKHLDAGPLSDCWKWTGATRNGYGVMKVDNKVVYAHRFSYELHYGLLTKGMNALHHCDNRLCCNPYHLFAGTKGDNARDMYAKKRGKGGGKKGQKPVVLTENDVRQIRELAKRGIKYPALSAQFGVSIPAISLIVTRKRWGHVP